MYKGGLVMSEYKRWISYIYSYENGEKKNNIGYARIETRDMRVKVTVHINVLSVKESMKVYLYVREGGVIRGLLIGEIAMNGGVGEGSFITSAQSVADSTYGINDVCGLIVFYDNNKFFGSEWDDKPIILEGSKGFVLNQSAEFTLQSSPNENSETDEVKEDVSTNHDEKDEDVEIYALEEAAVSEVESQKEEAVTEPEETVTEPEETVTQPETVVNEAALQSEEENINAAEKILLKYPRMYPFDDDEMQTCVRIEPQDIGQLPIDAWSIANNSFLLHGYYSYRHLVLMKTADKIHPAYFIGVPGIYRNKDEFMAKMFGFELFKPMSRKEDMTGEFGYWCVPITDIVL